MTLKRKSGRAIRCVICAGIEPRGCPGCNGAGIHTVSGTIGDDQPGHAARKGCGCVIDWCGDGIDAAHLAARRALWRERGYREEPMLWGDASRALTHGAACQHEQRQTPREDVASPLSIGDLPPGSGS